MLNLHGTSQAQNQAKEIEWNEFFGGNFSSNKYHHTMDGESSLNLDLDISDKAEEKQVQEPKEQLNDEDDVIIEIDIDDDSVPKPTEQVLETKPSEEKQADVDILDDIDLDIPDDILDDVVMEKPKELSGTNDASKPSEQSSNDNSKPETNTAAPQPVEIEDDVQIEDEEYLKAQATKTIETKPVQDKEQVLEAMDKYLDEKDKEFGDEAVEEIKKHLDVHLDDDAVEVIEFEDSQEYAGEKSITDEKVEDKELSADSEHDESKQPAKVVEMDGKKVEISVGKGEDMTAEKLEEKRVQAIKNIKSKASELSKKGLDFDASVYDDSEEINKFLRMIVGCMVVPPNSIKAESQTLHLDDVERWKIPTDEFVQKISFYPDFKCFQAPPENLLHSPDEILVICHDLNELFQFNFLDMHSTDFQFNEIPSRILKFTNKYADLKTTAFEENFLKAIYSKIEILLNTNVEAAFRSNSIKVTNDFWTAFGGYLKEMEQIQGRKEKLRASWNEFVVALFSMRVKNQIYRHASYSNLNEMLNTCYQPDGFLLIEQLVGNSLKCYFPTIIRSYFFMIRSVYMMARMVAIYSFLKLNKDKPKEQVRKDIYEIGAICTIAYETKYQMWKSEERAPIHGLKNEEISPQVQEYARNHVINGGQYFLLKSIETALPVIADSLQ